LLIKQCCSIKLQKRSLPIALLQDIIPLVRRSHDVVTGQCRNLKTSCVSAGMSRTGRCVGSSPDPLLTAKKIVLEKTFQGWGKIESSSRDSRDREVSWLLTSSTYEARTGLTLRTPDEED
jgi:hypothetical protein